MLWLIQPSKYLMEDHLRHKERTVQVKTLGDNDFRTFEKQNEDVGGRVGFFCFVLFNAFNPPKALQPKSCNHNWGIREGCKFYVVTNDRLGNTKIRIKTDLSESKNMCFSHLQCNKCYTVKKKYSNSTDETIQLLGQLELSMGWWSVPFSNELHQDQTNLWRKTSSLHLKLLDF